MRWGESWYCMILGIAQRMRDIDSDGDYDYDYSLVTSECI